MVKALKDLFVALLNATLILVAVCLFLILMILNRANDLTDSFTEQLQVVTPLREGVQNTATEIAGLRSDLKDIANQPEKLPPESVEALQARVDKMGTRLDSMQATLTELRGAPERMLDQALTQVGQHISDTAIRIRGCVPTENPELQPG